MTDQCRNRSRSLQTAWSIITERYELSHSSQWAVKAILGDCNSHTSILSYFTNVFLGPDLDNAYALVQIKQLTLVIQHYCLNFVATFTLIDVCHKALNIRIERLQEDFSFIQVL